MGLNVSDAIKTGFGSLKTDVGKKLVGIFFVIQAISFGSTLLIDVGSTALAAAGGLISIVVALASIAATIGGLRSFREDNLDRSAFTNNLAWPFGRILGAQLTTAVFGYLAALVFLGPAIVAAVLGGVTSLSGAAPALGSAGIAAVVLGAAGLLAGVTAFLYITITLILAQPLIAIDDKRLFQALDESIKRTKGSRLNIFLTGLVVFAIYFTAVLLGGLASVVSPQIGSALIQLIVVPVFTPVFLALLNHFSEELPLQ